MNSKRISILAAFFAADVDYAVVGAGLWTHIHSTVVVKSAVPNSFSRSPCSTK